MPAPADRTPATVAAFPSPSLMAQAAELKREAAMREQVYPRLIDRGQIEEEKALYQQRCLQGAIDTLDRLHAARAGQPVTFDDHGFRFTIAAQPIARGKKQAA